VLYCRLCEQVSDFVFVVGSYVIVGCYAVYLFSWVKTAKSANVVPYFCCWCV